MRWRRGSRELPCSSEFFIALAEDQLTAANWTALDIAAKDVQGPLGNAAVMGPTTIRSPILTLVAVTNAIKEFAPDLDLACLWPVLTHPQILVGPEPSVRL